jgi:2'-5' RNA ligase
MARLRTFIAVPLGKVIQDRCAVLQEELGRAGADLKWVEYENLHVSLLFLGEVDERDVLDVCRATTDACKGHAPFVLTVEGVGCFPNPRRPRVVWTGLSEGGPEVIALHDALEPPLLDLGCYRREDRQYTPHVTLGRVKGEHGTDCLAAALARHADWHGGTIDVREVHVLSSQLTPKGPIYAVLSRARLQSSERPSAEREEAE